MGLRGWELLCGVVVDFPYDSLKFIIYYIKLCLQIRIDVLLKFNTIKVEQLARSGKLGSSTWE